VVHAAHFPVYPGLQHITANKEEIKWQDLVPAEYHKYGKVFSDEEV
jgi:hypothetical protein